MDYKACVADLQNAVAERGKRDGQRWQIDGEVVLDILKLHVEGKPAPVEEPEPEEEAEGGDDD
jgi:hypothetical protein